MVHQPTAVSARFKSCREGLAVLADAAEGSIIYSLVEIVQKYISQIFSKLQLFAWLWFITLFSRCDSVAIDGSVNQNLIPTSSFNLSVDRFLPLSQSSHTVCSRHGGSGPSRVV